MRRLQSTTVSRENHLCARGERPGAVTATAGYRSVRHQLVSHPTPLFGQFHVPQSMADRRRRNSWPFVPTHLTTTPMPLAANPGECPHCGYHHDNHDACEHREEDDGDS